MLRRTCSTYMTQLTRVKECRRISCTTAKTPLKHYIKSVPEVRVAVESLDHLLKTILASDQTPN